MGKKFDFKTIIVTVFAILFIEIFFGCYLSAKKIVYEKILMRTVFLSLVIMGISHASFFIENQKKYTYKNIFIVFCLLFVGLATPELINRKPVDNLYTVLGVNFFISALLTGFLFKAEPSGNEEIKEAKINLEKNLQKEK